MATNNKSTRGQAASKAVARELDQLREKVKELTLRVEREVKARKLDVRLVAEAKKTREQLAREVKSLREQGRKLASQLKSTLGDASKREQLLEDARAKIAELRADLGRKTAELRRKSGELKKLAEESAHRAAAIIRGDAEHRAEPHEAEHAAPPAPLEPGSKGDPSDEPMPHSTCGIPRHAVVRAIVLDHPQLVSAR
jgi:chromosome segregation ATPase